MKRHSISFINKNESPSEKNVFQMTLREKELDIEVSEIGLIRELLYIGKYKLYSLGGKFGNI